MSEKLDWLRIAMIGIFLLAITAFFLGMIQGFLVTLFLAAVFSAMALPLYRAIRALLGGREVLASTLTILLLVIAVLFPSLLILAMMAGQAAELASNVEPLAQGAIKYLGNFQLKLPQWFPFREQLQAAGPQVASKIAEFAGQIGQFLVSSVAAATQGTARFFLQLFVLLYAMFYFLMDGPAIVERALRLTTLSVEMQRRIITQGYVVARATIRGSLTIGLIQGLLGGIGFMIFGIPNFVLWGVVMAISSLIPGVGTAIVWIPAVIYLYATGDTLPAIGLALWSAILVGTIDNVLRPRLVGSDAKMPDLVILVSTFGGLATFGATGLILGPVVAAVFFTAWEVFADANEPQARQGNAEPNELSEAQS